MVTISERVEDAKLRVFKWKDQSLFKDTVSEFGLFMFLLANHILIKSSEVLDNQAEEKTKNITKVSGFKVANLLSRNSIELLVRSALSSTGLFFQDTVQYLAQQISAYILLNFHFTTETLLGPDRSRIVIVIDLNMLRVLDYMNNNNNNTPGGENKYCFCLHGKKEDEKENNINVQPETQHHLGCMQSYLDEILGGDEDEKQDQNLLEEAEEEVLEEGSSEIMEIARELMPFLIQTPEILAQTKPKLSVRLRDFEKIRPPVKIEEFDGQLELCMCSICGSRVLTGTVVAKLPCLHVFHRDCIYQRVPNFNSCPLCGLPCATFI